MCALGMVSKLVLLYESHYILSDIVTNYPTTIEHVTAQLSKSLPIGQAIFDRE